MQNYFKIVTKKLVDLFLKGFSSYYPRLLSLRLKKSSEKLNYGRFVACTIENYPFGKCLLFL